MSRCREGDLNVPGTWAGKDRGDSEGWTLKDALGSGHHHSGPREQGHGSMKQWTLPRNCTGLGGEGDLKVGGKVMVRENVPSAHHPMARWQPMRRTEHSLAR